MTNKKWPKDGSAVDFAALVDPALSAIKQIYTLERKPKTLAPDWPGVVWRGYGTPSCAATCFEPDHALQGDNLRYSEEDQGREPLEEILGIVFRLGLEQGIRQKKADYSLPIQLLEVALKHLKGRP